MDAADSLLATADELFRDGKVQAAAAAYLEAGGETPAPAICVKLARCHEKLNDPAEALRWALAAAEAPEDYAAWRAAAAIARRTADAATPARNARIAVLGSYTTNQFSELLELALLRVGVAVEVYEADYGQYRQEVLDESSGMYRFSPDQVVFAVHAGALGLPSFSPLPEQEVEAEVDRWCSLWTAVGERSTATPVQHLFALPPEAPFGNLGATLAGSRSRMSQDVNARLAAAAGKEVAVVDCERLASLVGKRIWFDPRYWHMAKQAVALGALPLLASHTAAVCAARFGLGKKCLALDLDNTLWGGIVGEDGLGGLRLGGDAEGEAFQAFQDAILALKDRGVILAVCSKNNDADAREVFERHPEMRIKLDDVSAFVADWRPKPEQVRAVAASLDIGLDSIVFVDDNPAEREAIRQFLPEVDVITLPPDPAEYARALDDYLMFEPASFTAEDSQRAGHYRARQEAERARASADSIEDFYRSLEMEARISPFTDADLPRIAQLVGKTNQFNLTTRRHSAAELEAFMRDPDCVHASFRLQDRFTDHGLIAVLLAFQRDTTLEVDTWLMSCRVIGRTLESTVFEELCRAAATRGCTEIRGDYLPTAKNGLVADLYPRLGFQPAGGAVEDGTSWVYQLGETVAANEFIDAKREGETAHAPA